MLATRRLSPPPRPPSPLLIAMALLIAMSALQGDSAQACTMRVIVYVDASVSMHQSSARGTSPFELTLDALEDFLDADFVTQQTTLEVLSFGAGVALQQSTTGAAPGAFQSLRENPPREQVTIFGPVFEDLERRLETLETAAGRTLVIIASDFVVEPSPRFDYERGRSSWAEDWNRSRAALSPKFHQNGLSAVQLSLFSVNPNDNSDEKARLQRLVLDELDSFPTTEISRISSAATRSTLADGIKKRLAIPPSSRAQLTASGTYTVELQNRGCISLKLTSIDLKCPSEKGELPVPVSAHPVLGPSGSPTSLGRYPVNVSTFPCKQDYEVLVGTLETGRNLGTTARVGTRLDVELKKATVTPGFWFLPTWIELELGLQGVESGADQFNLTIRDGSGMQLADTRFELPDSLPESESRSYRLVTPSSGAINDRENIVIEAPEAALAADSVPASRKPLNRWAQAITGLMTLIFSGLLIYSWMASKEGQIDLKPAEALGLMVQVLATPLVWLVANLLLTHQRALESLTGSKEWLLAILALAIWVFFYWPWQQKKLADLRLRNNVNTGTMDFPAYVKAVRKGKFLRASMFFAAIGLLAVLLVLLAYSQLHSGMETLKLLPIPEKTP